MNKIFIKNNITMFAMLLFFTLYILIIFVKPGFIFNRDGSLRDFGIGYKKKTVIPLWLMAILLALVSYILLLVFLNHS
jgi:hypothetical protein